MGVQFHRLYHLHGCLARWHCFAAAAVLARRREETDRIVAQQEAQVCSVAVLLYPWELVPLTDWW